MAETQQRRHWLLRLPVKVSQPIRGEGPVQGSVSEWTQGAVIWLRCPHSKLLAVGDLDRREGPGAAKRDPRIGGSRLLCAKPTAQRR